MKRKIIQLRCRKVGVRKLDRSLTVFTLFIFSTFYLSAQVKSVTFNESIDFEAGNCTGFATYNFDIDSVLNPGPTTDTAFYGRDLSYLVSENMVEVTVHNHHFDEYYNVIGQAFIMTTPTGNFVDDCNNTSASFSNFNAYLMNDSVSYISEKAIVPFVFGGNLGFYCAKLYITKSDYTISFKGYSWDTNPHSTPQLARQFCQCSDSWLGIEKNQPQEGIGTFKYYNLMGQLTDNPQGLTLKVYENGFTEKVFVDHTINH